MNKQITKKKFELTEYESSLSKSIYEHPAIACINLNMGYDVRRLSLFIWDYNINSHQPRGIVSYKDILGGNG